MENEQFVQNLYTPNLKYPFEFTAVPCYTTIKRNVSEGNSHEL